MQTMGARRLLTAAVLCFSVISAAHGQDPLAQPQPEPCRSNQFQCENKRCIPAGWVCDDDYDCNNGDGDRSDETDCPDKTCGPGQFACLDGLTCITNGWRCDGEEDCTDGSDESPDICTSGLGPELQSYQCPANHYRCLQQCPDGGGPCTETCVHYDTLCDNNPDCPSGDDEGPQCTTLPRLCANGRGDCQEACTVSSAGRVCFCRNGYVVSPDRTCKDLNECELPGFCDQLCVNTEGSYTCSCASGYTLLPDKKTCRAQNNDSAVLVVANRQRLNMLYLNGTAVPGKELITTGAMAMDISLVDNKICWVQVEEDVSKSSLRCVQRSNFTQAGAQVQKLTSSVHHVEQMAYDWLTGNMYFTDDEADRVFACNKEGRVCVTVIEDRIANPRGIALDPTRGLMFLSDYGSTPRIEKAHMDGTNRSQIVTSKIVLPHGIALDIVTQTLYWVDAYLNYIESVDYNGQNRRTIAQGPMVEHLYGITVFERYLYATDWHEDTIIRVDRWNTSAPIVTLATDFNHAGSLKVLHPVVQPVIPDHACMSNQCQDICLLAGSKDKKICRCRPGFSLKPDGKCEASKDETFLVYSKSRPGVIKGISLTPDDFTDKMVPIEHLDNPRAFDFHAAESYIYFSDPTQFRIGRQKITGEGHEILVNSSLNNCEGVAVDWIGGNLYWTDDGLNTISVSRLDGTHRRTLISGNMTHPRSIVVDPTSGMMYWSDWVDDITDEKFAKIEQAWMDGTNRKDLINRDNTAILWPNGLALDHVNSKLYWADAFYDKIMRVDLKKGDVGAVYKGEVLIHPFGLALHENHIYWTEFRTGEIKMLDLNDNSSITHIKSDQAPLFEIRVYSKSLQTGSNACASNNHVCPSLCLITPGNKAVCSCPDGQQVMEDGKNCEDIANYTKSPQCSSTEFACASGQCIPERWKCDGDRDCQDGSDELPAACTGHTCQPNQFRCNSSRCIPDRWVCDGDKDCGETGEDELGCNERTCGPGQFHCNSSRCIPEMWVCDRDNDCGDMSDEPSSCEHPSCDPTQFQCDNGRCISPSWRCDTDNDCTDNSDEKDCTYSCNNETQHKCLDTGRCISKRWVCDGDYDCQDHSDEPESCASTNPPAPCDDDEFQCHSGQCILARWRCDKDEDCMDKSDEFNCTGSERPCDPEQEFQCKKSGECISLDWRCDQEEDCEDGSDEKDCKDTCELPNRSCANDTTICLSPDKFCNKKPDCPDGSDEGKLCDIRDCDINNGGCSHICQPWPMGVVCLCPSDLRLGADNKTCEEVKWCEQLGICSQICTPVGKSYRCECQDGWQLEPDEYTCRSTDPATPYVIFSNRHELRRIDLSSKDFQYRVLVPGLRNTIAVDYDLSTNSLFWTDVVEDKIFKGNMSSTGGISSIRPVVQTGLATAEGLAVDWVGKNIYWVESNLDQIEVARLNGMYRTTLIAEEMESPRAIALDPRIGYLFWTDWQSNRARIERCDMSGTNRSVIHWVASDGGWPNGLTVDYLDSRIFWVDAKSDSITSADYDGKAVRKVLWGHRHLSHPFSISLYAEKVFWTDWRTNMLASANKYTGGNFTILQRTSTQPFDLQIVHPTRQPSVDHPCANKTKNDCSHLCLIGYKGSYACRCPQRYKLKADNKTCELDGKFLLYARQLEVRGVDLLKPYYNMMSALTLPHIGNVTAVDFDAKEERIYWVDLRFPAVRRAFLNGSDVETLVTSQDLTNTVGIAVDWLSRNLYWTVNFGEKKAIVVSQLDGSFKRTLNMSLTAPGYLAVHPSEGLIFWSDGGDVPYIGRANADGSSVSKIVQNVTTLSLALDHVGKRLYWINSNKTVSSCNLDGSDMKTIAGAVQQNMSRPHALAVGGSLMYWGDHTSDQIMVASKADGSGLKVFRARTTKVMDIKIFDSEVQTRTGPTGSNPCSTNNGGCQQLCLPAGAVKKTCSCTAGYELQADNMKCTGLSEFILYSVHEEIRGIQLAPQQTSEPSDALSPIRGSALAVAIDFFAENDTIYWVDTAMKSIHVSNRNQTWQDTVITTDMGRVEGIAVDWVAKNIYWTDQQFDLIEVARWNGSFRHVIVSTDLDKPRDIVVHPTLGYIFWSDWGAQQKIERAAMDGSQRIILYNGTGLQWPNGMAVDYETNMVYWVDANSNSIERIGINGQNHEYILTVENQDLFAISLYKDNIYWTDRTYKSGVIMMGSKDNATINQRTLRENLGIQLKDIAVFSQQRQNGTNICGPHMGTDGKIVENGGCEQLCLYVGNNKRKCRCGHGMLADDGTSCKEHDAYLLYSERVSLKSAHVLDSKNRPIGTIQLKDNMRNVIGLAFDYGNGTNKKRIFYSDIHHGNLQSVYEDGTGQQIIVENVGSVEGLAYHRRNDELFWTSYTDSNIRRFSLNQTKPGARNETIVVLSQEDHPRAIVLDECQGRIWWTNWNDKSPSIMTSYVGGQEVRSIVKGSDIRTPNGLAIDHAAEKLYWSDATLDKIERCNYDGSKRVVILQVEPVHSFGLAVYGDYIYWTDWVRRSVMAANKLDGSNVKVLRSDISQQPMGIIAVANETNNCMLSPCRTLNGGCDHECSVMPNGLVNCSCRPPKILMDATRCIVPEVTCSPSQFECSASGCVAYEDSCDGIPDCTDGSDEANPYCATRDCRDGWKRCRNGRCISEQLWCNGKDDCHDNSDEDRCDERSCAPGEFRCNNGRCIDESLRCDQRIFCDDASDEIGCPPVDCSTYRERGLEEVLSGYINCNKTSLCILPQWRCDGENDCGDNSDEEDCFCGSGYFQCDNGRCIPKSWKCDNDNDCGDNSDEPPSCSFSCTKEQFTCNNTRCIPLNWKCDGEQDCEDGSDESTNLQCDRITCPPEQFRCVENARCIPKHWTCDGDNDCPDASDEMASANCTFTETCDSDEFQCQNRRCIQSAWVCDHDNDCGDGSDEEECTYTTCAPDQFQCANARCIPSSWTCDRDNDCNDNSDEAPSNKKCEPSCSEEEFMCTENSQCIPWNMTCDGNKDCSDGSDEPAGLCGRNECLDAEFNNCTQVCQDLRIGFRCKCHKGYRMNGAVCEDIDECNTEFPCSQYCINTYGSYRCRCAEGYSKDPAQPGVCKVSSDVKPYIMFSNRYYIRKLDFSGRTYEIVLGGLNNAVALDFDVKEERIYWTDVTTQRSMIRRAYINGSNFEVLHSTALSNPDGIAVDWVGRNLYWCDKAKDVIEVSWLNGDYRKVLYKDGLKEPRALVVEPQGGYLYWTDWGENPHIGRSWLDGSHGKVIINSTRTKIGWPNGLTVDYVTKRIFWGDAREDHIQFAEADGSNIHTVISESGIPHIFGLSLFEDYIFWTDWETKGVHKAHKYTGANATQLVTSVHRPMDIHIYHPYRQRSIPNHPCSINNGGCKNLCLLQPGGKHTCACAENFYLASDGKTCLSNCTSSQFECGNFKCIPFWWKCDTENDCDDGSDEPDDCPPFVCRPGQFQCNNSDCTNPAFICDGDQDCSDGSDERNCEHHTCLPNQFKCKGENKCIPGIFRCNGATNCQDGSDEESCPERTCAANQFKCNSSKICIPRVWMCDGDNDCGDGSDEPNNCTARSCSENELRCNNTGRCIPARWQCDGDNDCGDSSDEQVGVCSARTCDQYQHRCNNNKCIPARWRCDYDDDCGDNSDEEGCTPRPCSESEFQCDDNRCIPGRWKCDGDHDCENGSDESGCSSTCAPNQFKCRNGHCIPEGWHCDLDRDCLDGSDEENCEVTEPPGVLCKDGEFQCNNTLCKPLSWKCDGEDDCGDKSDEEAFMCKNFVCPPTRQFRCRNDRVCLPISRRCDGFSHCDDNSDEMDCRAPAENRTCTADDFKCLSGDRCVKLDLVCNNYDNCGDGSDEGLCGPPNVNECQNNNGNCQHKCTDLPRGHYCTCRDGYTLNQDLTSCQDINECEDFGRCSQVCTNTKGSFHCSCSPGFIKARGSNGLDTCIAEGDPDYLLIADDNVIKRINPDNSRVGSGDGFRGNDETRVESMDIDVKSNMAYWSNIHTSGIYRATIQLNNKRRKRQATDIVKLDIRDLEEPRGIAIDWVGRHIYWTDARKDALEVADLDGNNRKTLLNTGMDRPHSVAVDPKNGYVFWTDWGLSPKIERARLDGLERRVLVREDLQWPTGLAIDYQNRRLYWADAKKNTIESIDFDGSGRVVAANYSKGLRQPYLIDLFEDNIYGTTYHTGEVFKVDKFGRDNVTVLANNLQHASDVVIFQQHKQDQTITNPCSSSNCTHLCFRAPMPGGGTICACPNGGKLDGNSCTNVPAPSPEPTTAPCEVVCFNGGTCIPNEQGNPKCKCPPNFHGPQCRQNKCNRYCANNGRCQLNSMNKPVCITCINSFFGPRCNSSCDNYCLNGGSCSVSGNRGVCDCLPRYEGNRCQTDRCDGYCKNGAHCTVLPDRSLSCASPACETFDCSNGGACDINKLTNKPFCNCSENFQGPHCEIPKDLCFEFCQNGGQCSLDANNQPVCSCEEGYEGTQCTETVPANTGKRKGEGGDGGTAAAIAVPVVLALIIIAVICGVCFYRKRSSRSGWFPVTVEALELKTMFQHKRMTNNVEIGNPTFLYDQEEDDETEQLDPSLTLDPDKTVSPVPCAPSGLHQVEDDKYRLEFLPTNFSNPVYDCLYNEASGSSNSLTSSDEKKGLLSPSGIQLYEDQNDPFGGSSVA
ncbi:prolow-density lipoprotein receptor-related protein 1-like isoform X3 [Branchiostoma floridae x Branchiostoma belcheri]